MSHHLFSPWLIVGGGKVTTEHRPDASSEKKYCELQTGRRLAWDLPLDGDVQPAVTVGGSMRAP